jgi:hypothetical protein
MNAKQLRDILICDEYKRDLTELSSYLASIKQERPIIYFLAKQLRKRGIGFQLEAKPERTDLVVDGTSVEFKFNYDCDMAVLHKELEKAGDKLLKDVCAEKSTHGWIALPRLYADMVNRVADVFVWIILSRDLSQVDENARTGICASGPQRKWNKTHTYSDRTYLNIAQQFLDKVRAEKEFSVIKEEIPTMADFPSTYHFWFCEFAGG